MSFQSPPSPGPELDAPHPMTHAPSLDLGIGQVFGGKYRVLDRLGAGGMAVVYRAQEQGMLTREVAIKVLTPESALSQATIFRFLKEAQAISNIKHPNVVQLIELGRTDDGQIYLVMERLLGKTLLEILREMGANGEIFTWDRLAPVILQICRALHAAHKQKIIHRDIKPSNCFCCEMEDGEWHVKVLDFGIAKVQSEGTSDDSIETPLTQEGMFLGTPHYAAPEIIDKRPEHSLDGRVDIFSLGVMMYQCLTGTLPFHDVRDSRVAVLYRAAHESPQSPRLRAPELHIPPDVDALIMRAMALRPEDRFATVSEVAAAIRATLRVPGALFRGGGLMVTGSIVEITPMATETRPTGSSPPTERPKTGPPEIRASVSVSTSKVVVPPGDSTPLPQTHAAPQGGSSPFASPSPSNAHTSIQSTATRVSIPVLVTLAAMAVGVVVLLALIIHESGASPSPERQKTGPVGPPSVQPSASSRPSSRDGALRPPTPIAPTPAPARAPLEPAPPEPVSARELLVESHEADAGPSSAPAGPPADSRKKAAPDPQQARKRAARAQLDALAESAALLKCLPLSTSFADGVHDELPISLQLDAKGKATASVTGAKVKRRVPRDKEACILKQIGSATFQAGDGPLSLPHVLRFD